MGRRMLSKMFSLMLLLVLFEVSRSDEVNQPVSKKNHDGDLNIKLLPNIESLIEDNNKNGQKFIRILKELHGGERFKFVEGKFRFNMNHAHLLFTMHSLPPECN